MSAAGSVRPPRVVVFNVAYSENVGDGVIAECMRVALEARGASVHVIDLSGRTGYGQRTVRARTLMLLALGAMPAMVKRRIVGTHLERTMRSLEPAWTQALQGADLAVIGGGNLLQDDGLNFPTKVAAAVRLCTRLGVPVRVHAVGVVEGWSARAQALFGAFNACDLRGVSVRDAASADAWRKQSGSSIAADVVPDPGLMAGALIGKPHSRPAANAPSPVIGLGILHPAVAAHHAHDGAVVGDKAFFATLAERMLERGWHVRLFCNGARDDHALARRVLRCDALREAREAGRITLAPRPETACELVDLVAGLDGLVAHRLHALIVAEGLGVPAIGLPWDSKVRRFLASVERPDDTAHPSMAPDEVAELIALALQRVPNRGERRRAITQARMAVEELLRDMSALPRAANDGCDPHPPSIRMEASG